MAAADVERDVLLGHRPQRAQAPGLADVRRHRETVRRVADHVAAQPQPREAALRLHPVQERAAERAGAVVRSVEHRLVGVVDLRPVHQRDVARVAAGREQATRCDPAEAPQVLVEVGVVEVGADGERVLVRVRVEAARHGAQRLRIRGDPGEAVREALVLRGARDRVVLARVMVEREADRDRLQVARLVLRRRVRLARPLARLEASHVLGAGEREQRAGLGRVEYQIGLHGDLAVRSGERDRLDAVAVDRGAGRRVAQQHLQPPGGERRCELRVKHGERHARFVSEPRHRARARVQLRQQPGALDQRVVGAVMRADPVAQPPVAPGAAAALDPAVLVRRDRLAGELAADPAGRLRHHDVVAPRGGGERGRDAAQAAAHDEDVASSLGHRRLIVARHAPGL